MPAGQHADMLAFRNAGRRHRLVETCGDQRNLAGFECAKSVPKTPKAPSVRIGAFV